MNVKKFAVVPIENPIIHIGFLDYTLSSDNSFKKPVVDVMTTINKLIIL